MHETRTRCVRLGRVAVLGSDEAEKCSHSLNANINFTIGPIMRM